MKRVPLHIQILAAVALAVAAGLILGESGRPGSDAFLRTCAFVGDLFLNALRMLVVPLVVAAVVSGIAGIGATHGFGRLSLKTLGYYLTTTLIAVLIGLCAVNLIRPGSRGGTVDAEQVREAAQSQLARAEGRGFADLAGLLQRLVPQNVVQSAAEGDMLGLIFFSLLFGFFLSRLPPPRQGPLLEVIRGIYDIMLMITGLVMRFAPIGVFALVARVVATTGVDVFRQAALFFLTVLLGLAVHAFVVLPILLQFLGGVRPARHFRAMSPALLTAFSTASSSATLPLTIECVEKRAGVSHRTSSFVLPLGATVNMDGTALYECVAVLFIAQAYGIELGFVAQIAVVLLALLTSIGVAGIPAASLVAIVIIMNAVGVPAEGLGLILAVDRILDMCRTSVNIFSDSCGAVIIGRSEGETGILER